ncbi:hypothetical protein CEK28_10635 [Xenophilus sp. AP218F]|nr:hypothetical protein CEK28_10635 [Xenophilus sp. AP218F]
MENEKLVRVDDEGVEVYVRSSEVQAIEARAFGGSTLYLKGANGGRGSTLKFEVEPDDLAKQLGLA